MAFRPRLATGLAFRVMTLMLGEGSTHNRTVAHKKMRGESGLRNFGFFGAAFVKIATMRPPVFGRRRIFTRTATPSPVEHFLHRL